MKVSTLKLPTWRGENVLITDTAGGAVLTIDAQGNVKEVPGRPDPGPGTSPKYELPAETLDPPRLKRLAAQVARWIEWTAIEVGEFRACDIHPAIRRQVTILAEPYIDSDSKSQAKAGLEEDLSPAA